MERCARCGKTEQEVRLFDAIYEGRMENICERCSLIENIPIIRKPSISQLKDSEKNLPVVARLKQISGMREQKKDSGIFIADRLKQLDEIPELELPEQKKLNLINHFHWYIQKYRRKKSLTQEKLAEAIGESAIAIKMIENARLPEHADIIITKLEQLFQMNLRNISDRERWKSKREPVLRDEKGKEIEIIPEPEFEIQEKESESDSSCKFEIKTDEKTPLVERKMTFECGPGKAGEFNIRSIDPNRVNIRDLRNMHKRKIQATKQERQEEAKKIEERQKLIEARREELRQMKEREMDKIDRHLRGIDVLEKKNPDFDRNDFDDEIRIDEDEE